MGVKPMVVGDSQNAKWRLVLTMVELANFDVWN
jgi:hypothetical protein